MLKPGGFVILSTPNFAFLLNRLRILSGKLSIDPQPFDPRENIFGRPTILYWSYEAEPNSHVWRGPADKLRQLATLYSLVSLDRKLVYLSLALSLLLTALVLAALARRSRRRRLLWSDGLLLVAALLVVLYFAAPNEMSGGGFVTHRLNLFPFLIAILWLIPTAGLFITSLLTPASTCHPFSSIVTSS